jgi:DNA-directed RNA polymerase subunit RPC12/RpoP
MSLSALTCPHCVGSFLVDSSMAGQQALCPNCKGMVVIPPIEPTAPPVWTSEPASQFACPVCLQAFSALGSMAGQQVLCPHCGSAVMMPHSPESSPSMPPVPQPVQETPLPPLSPRPEPQYAPIPSPVVAAPPSKPTPSHMPPAAKPTSRNRPVIAPMPEINVEHSPAEVIPTIREPAEPPTSSPTAPPVRKLSPQERARYRLIKNAIVLAICAAVLALLFLVLRYAPILKELSGLDTRSPGRPLIATKKH